MKLYPRVNEGHVRFERRCGFLHETRIDPVVVVVDVDELSGRILDTVAPARNRAGVDLLADVPDAVSVGRRHCRSRVGASMITEDDFARDALGERGVDRAADEV